MGIIPNGPGAPRLAGADRDAAVAAVKRQLRVGLPDDDALIAALAESALGLAEQFTGQVLLRRAMTLPVAATTRWCRMPVAPVVAVTGAVGADADGGESAAPPGSWSIDLDAEGRAWLRADTSRQLRVTLTAGLAGGWGDLPAALAEGVTLLAAHLFDARGDTPPPAAVSALWRPYRMLRLGGEVRA